MPSAVSLPTSGRQELIMTGPSSRTALRMRAHAQITRKFHRHFECGFWWTSQWNLGIFPFSLQNYLFWTMAVFSLYISAQIHTKFWMIPVQNLIRGSKKERYVCPAIDLVLAVHHWSAKNTFLPQGQVRCLL